MSVLLAMDDSTLKIVISAEGHHNSRVFQDIVPECIIGVHGEQFLREELPVCDVELMSVEWSSLIVDDVCIDHLICDVDFLVLHSHRYFSDGFTDIPYFPAQSNCVCCHQFQLLESAVMFDEHDICIICYDLG